MATNKHPDEFMPSEVQRFEPYRFEFTLEEVKEFFEIYFAEEFFPKGNSNLTEFNSGTVFNNEKINVVLLMIMIKRTECPREYDEYGFPKKHFNYEYELKEINDYDHTSGQEISKKYITCRPINEYITKPLYPSKWNISNSWKTIYDLSSY